MSVCSLRKSNVIDLAVGHYMAICYKLDREPSSSLEGWQLLEQLGDSQQCKKDFAPWSYCVRFRGNRITPPPTCNATDRRQR
jgi:hypothetical protein